MKNDIFTIEIYQNSEGKKPFIEWMNSLKDTTARAKINVRLARIRLGNLGDYKSLGEGIFELRVNEGPGYRIYFTQNAEKKIILLGGSKKTQPKEIVKARDYLEDYRRNKDVKKHTL
ncbi:MAG: type II toxin-antitoxin system RelE/ParE family toxin [Alphaproteobacteria bacterium]|nr:type II toxin-antitoxin system RelE/ParE family toxin [Alphaproteobacteria bacterium]